MGKQGNSQVRNQLGHIIPSVVLQREISRNNPYLFSLRLVLLLFEAGWALITSLIYNSCFLFVASESTGPRPISEVSYGKGHIPSRYLV